MLSREQLKSIMPLAGSYRRNLFYEHIIETLEKYDINTPLRIAAFLAQIAHESGELQYVREIASGEAYEGRHDLGNTQPGDGKRYRGRGLIQVTGRANYKSISDDFGIDFVNYPDFLECPKYASLSAGWYWDEHDLNELADNGDMRKITRVINGGFNGLYERLAYYKKAKEVLL